MTEARGPAILDLKNEVFVLFEQLGRFNEIDKSGEEGFWGGESQEDSFSF